VNKSEEEYCVERQFKLKIKMVKIDKERKAFSLSNPFQGSEKVYLRHIICAKLLLPCSLAILQALVAAWISALMLVGRLPPSRGPL
jgi:hypothetical protein